MSSELGYFNIEQRVLQAIAELIINAKGTCVCIYPKKIAKLAGLRLTPVSLSVIHHILRDLEAKGLIQFWSYKNRKYRYLITKDSPLWVEIKQKVSEH